jgi:hypothetical protein
VAVGSSAVLGGKKSHFEVSLLVPGSLPQMPNINPNNPNNHARPIPHNPSVNLIMLGNNNAVKKPMSAALPKANTKNQTKMKTICLVISAFAA